MSDRPVETLDQAIPGGTQALLLGAFVATLAHGIEFTLYAMTYFLLWKTRNQANNRRNLFFICYISIIFILSLLYIIGLLVFVQSLIFGKNSAPSPGAKLPAAILLTNDAMVIKDWLCSIINIWRCIVIYQGCRVPSWLVNLVPSFLYLVIIALGVYSLITNLPIAVLNMFFPSVLDSVFFIVSLLLNVLVTTLLVLRLLVYRRQIVRLLGSAQGTQYTSLATMIVESAFIHSSAAIPVIIMKSVPSVAVLGEIFLLLLSPLQGISTFLIIFRVAQGKAWSPNNYENTFQLSVLRFAARTNDGRSSLGADTASVVEYGHERCEGARVLDSLSVWRKLILCHVQQSPSYNHPNYGD